MTKYFFVFCWLPLSAQGPELALPDPPKPVVHRITPRYSYPGSNIAIEGRNFGDDPYVLEVRLGGKTAGLLYANDSGMVIQIPPLIGRGITNISISREGVTADPFVFEIRKMDYLKTGRHLLGGVVFMVLGVFILSVGFNKGARTRHFSFIPKYANKKRFALPSGAAFSALTQSTAGTAVILMGFASSGQIKLKQGLTLLLGAAIGASFFPFLLIFDITSNGIWLIALGFGLVALPRLLQKSGYPGEIILGFGLLLFGMELIKNGLSPIAQKVITADALRIFSSATMSGTLACLVTGLMGAFILHSNGALAAIVICAAQTTQILDLNAALLIMVGGNTGPFFTTMLMSRGEGPMGQKIAVGHALLNFSGALVALMLFNPILQLSSQILQTNPALIETGKRILHPNVTAHFSLGYLLINLASSLVFLPLLGPLSRILEDQDSSGKEV